MIRRQWLDLVGLALVVCAVYGNSLSGSFHYDDFHSLVQNVHIRDLQRIPDFFLDPSLFSVDPDKAMYRPLLLVSFALNYALGGYEVVGYHLVNILIHLACVLLLWSLAITHGRSAALCAGLVFALHPVATEPVNYISSRSESLAVALLLLAFACYTRRGRLGRMGGALVFAAALMVKSIAIVLPGFLLLYAYCQTKERFEWRWHLPYWIVALSYVLIIATNRFLADSLAKAPRGLMSQLFTQCKAVVFYLKIIAVPIGLNVEPQFSTSDLPTMTVLASAALIASGIYMAYNGQKAGFYLGWTVLALSPTLIIPLNVLVNEHRLYLPLAGLALGVGACSQRLVKDRLLWPGIACLVIWGGLTVQRNADWNDELSLWSAAAERESKMPRVYVHLGNALRDRGHLSEARSTYEKALSFDPSSRSANTNLANLYYEAGLADSARQVAYMQKAIALYEGVLKIDSAYREALNNMGSAHMLLGDYDRADQAWNLAIERHPNHADAHYNQGLLQARLGRSGEAVRHYRRALALGADAQIYREMGNVLADSGQLDGAAIAYRRAIGLNGADVASRYNLAEVLLVSGEKELAQTRNRVAADKWREARSELQSVIKMDPAHVRAQRRLSQLQERMP